MKAATLRMRKWRKNNPERSLENNRRWVKANPEKVLAKYSRWLDKNREEEAARNKASYPAYYKANKETIKSRNRLYRHHITQEWVDAKLIEQNNRCALCTEFFIKTPHIDHDHRCCSPLMSCDKCRRGLLCRDCNLGLGRFKDNIETLERAIEYLKRYKNGMESKP